jgi:hypothetical protein
VVEVDPWFDDANVRNILNPSSYDAVSSSLVTRYSGVWLLYNQLFNSYPMVRATIDLASSVAWWDKNPEFIASFLVTDVSANVRGWILLCSDTYSAGNAKIGIYLEGSTVKIMSCINGGADSYTTLGTIATGMHIIKMRYVSGVKIQAWLDRGAVVEKTTDLPSGMTMSDLKFLARFGGVADTRMQVYPPRILRGR